MPKFVPRRTILSLLFSCALSSALAQAPAAPVGETVIDVKNGDQKGKLSVRQTELAFDSLTDAKQSRTWKYADIRTLEKRIFKGMRVRPFKGSRYDFQFDNGGNRDRIFDLISQRVIEARRNTKR